jgi:hypothetical protein
LALGSRRASFRDDEELHAPHLVDVEMMQALRRLVRTGDVASRRANEAIADLSDLDLHRHAHVDLLDRLWALRENITAYDATYVALAEALDATLGHLRRAAGKHARASRPHRSPRVTCVALPRAAPSLGDMPSGFCEREPTRVDTDTQARLRAGSVYPNNTAVGAALPAQPLLRS